MTAAMPAPSPWRLRRRPSPLSPSSQKSAQRQRLRGVGVSCTQLREGAALLAAVQAELQLSSSYSDMVHPSRDHVQVNSRGQANKQYTGDRLPADFRRADNQYSTRTHTTDSRRTDNERTDRQQTDAEKRSDGIQALGQGAGHLGTTARARSRTQSHESSVDTGSIQAESWPFFKVEVPQQSDKAVARTLLPKDSQAVPRVGADGWPTGSGTVPLRERVTSGKPNRQPTSVSGTRPSTVGRQTLGRFRSEGAARPAARPSTSEGCQTFGRPAEARRVSGSTSGRPATVDGTRPRRGAGADEWSGHGDGASWFHAEQETARREQAAAKGAEECWRAHFDSHPSAPGQGIWERRQARRRAAEERSERRASQFRAQKLREQEVMRQQSAMDDIWSEAESDLHARARERAQAKAKVAQQKADAEGAKKQVPTSDQVPRGPPEHADTRLSVGDEGGLEMGSSQAIHTEDQEAYDDDELLDAWDAVCGADDRDTELDVDQVGQLLEQLGKPVGCYELQYIVSKIGDQVTGRVGLQAFRKWWDDVLREFAEWCATQTTRSSSKTAQDVGSESYGRIWKAHSSSRSNVAPSSATGGSASGAGENKGYGLRCDDSLLSHEECKGEALAATAVVHVNPEELAASAEQEVEAARAAAVAQSHAEAEQLRWKRHIAEKQRARVLAHRGQQKALEEEAAAKRELIGRITDRLARQIRGKTFVSVLKEFGLSVAKGEAAYSTAVHKAYRRALSIYHPDRATRRGLSWQKVTEAEETYKMLQTQYEKYVAQQQPKQQNVQRRR